MNAVNGKNSFVYTYPPTKVCLLFMLHFCCTVWVVVKW